MGQKHGIPAPQAAVSNSQPSGDTHLAARNRGQVEFSLEAPMPAPVVCVMCDQPEERCTCEKYCTICKGQHNIRLGADGLYYCPDCREACDIPAANFRDR